MKISFRLILSTLAATAALTACTKEITPPNFEKDKVNPAAEGSRIIAVSFGSQTKTYLDKDGLQPKFEDGKDTVLISNTNALDTCVVSVKDNKATISTNLTGPLTAVYPYKAAKMSEDNENEIDTVLVSTVQSGKFADANICMAKMKDENDESISFENKTAVFCIYPPTENLEYVEVCVKDLNIANDYPTGSDYQSFDTVHVATTTADSVYVSILVPDGLKVSDLTFSDGTYEKSATDDRAATLISVNTLYTVTSGGWEKTVADYVEIAAKYDGTNITTLKWYRQNLAITDSGKGAWKGINASAVKVPGTNEDVIVGDYFQWAASYAGYGITDPSEQKPENLLLYDSFTFCQDGEGNSYFTLKDENKVFNDESYAPYLNESYTKYNDSDKNKYPHLELCDDAVRAVLGEKWRMPTFAEFSAMMDVTYWQWDDNDKGYYIYTPNPASDAGKVNGDGTGTYNKDYALLFFPAAGSLMGDDYNSNSGNTCCYWSSTLKSVVEACVLYGDSAKTKSDDGSLRNTGNSIRPVQSIPPFDEGEDDGNEQYTHETDPNWFAE